ncbi:hypothetical protein B0H17DRAFT_1139461 [Mycena rosella]|uniref:Uncharacterized protein n=1 Tax=Mycena rosella TaxID=1033263 RepID=A0AAD7D4M9_MYCRO|nr:hypothetical protein B0H17DRAFT_1139461 [Mycena rosella]
MFHGTAVTGTRVSGSVEHFHQQKQHSFAFSEGRKLNIEMKVGTSPSLLTALLIILLGTRNTHCLDDFKSRMDLIFAVRVSVSPCRIHAVSTQANGIEPKPPPPPVNSHQPIQFGTGVGVDWPRAAALEPVSVESVCSPAHPGEVQLRRRRRRWRAYTRASRVHVPGSKPVARDSVLAVHDIDTQIPEKALLLYGGAPASCICSKGSERGKKNGAE